MNESSAGHKEQRTLETQGGRGRWELPQPTGQNWPISMSHLGLGSSPEQSETPSCHFKAILKLPGESSIKYQLEMHRSKYRTIWILISRFLFYWTFSCDHILKRSLCIYCRNRNSTLILLPQAESSALQYWWHTISRRCPPFLCPVLGHDSSLSTFVSLAPAGTLAVSAAFSSPI